MTEWSPSEVAFGPGVYQGCTAIRRFLGTVGPEGKLTLLARGLSAKLGHEGHPVLNSSLFPQNGLHLEALPSLLTEKQNKTGYPPLGVAHNRRRGAELLPPEPCLRLSLPTRLGLLRALSQAA